MHIHTKIYIYIYIERERENLKNNLIQNDEFNIKESRRNNVSVSINNHQDLRKCYEVPSGHRWMFNEIQNPLYHFLVLFVLYHCLTQPHDIFLKYELLSIDETVCPVLCLYNLLPYFVFH